ncbi:MAG: HDOD domain-containing protein [Chromatiales bacterium]|nr:HDOD domain-containing protein [Chromatiales bacterium]
MATEEEQKFDVKSFATELRDDIENNRIKLPTLPAISLEALLVVNDADSSMADVAKVIIKDTSMATRLVRYANSPLYAGTVKVTSVKMAITRIGFDAVKHAILSLAMKDVFSTPFKLVQKRMELLWVHSVRVASIATLIAGYLPHIKQDEAMLAGLIHDVGVIPILLKAKDRPELAEQSEQLDKVTKALHMLVGKFLLQYWNFEKTFIDVAAQHDRLDRKCDGDKADHVDVIQIANILSYADDDQHAYSELDITKLPAYRRIGDEVVTQVMTDIEDGAAEQSISHTLL